MAEENFPQKSNEDLWPELLGAVANERDRSAFGLLFEHFAPRVKAYMQRSGIDSTQSEDITQEVMLNIWRSAHHYDPHRASVATWIFTIARNKRIDHLRRQHFFAVDEADPDLLADFATSATDQAVRGQEAKRLRTALASLSPDQAEVLRLNFFEDLSHTKIADRLGLPLGTVKSRVRLALNRLNNILRIVE